MQSPEEIDLAVKAFFSDEARRKWLGLPRGWRRENPTDFCTICTWAVGKFLGDNSTPSFVGLETRLVPPRAPHVLPFPATTLTSNSPASSSPSRVKVLYQSMVENTRIALRCPKVWRLILALAIGGILVQNIESTISSNSVEIGENIWTYGQVMAAILTAIPVFQLAQFIGLVPSFKKRRMHNANKEKVL